MSGIMKRVKDILSSNAHAALNKMEDPEKMAEQNMREAVEKLAELKEAAAELDADLQTAQRNYNAAKVRADKEHEFAVNAMKSGDEDAAAKFLASEEKIRQLEVAPAENNLSAARNNYDTIRAAYNKLADEINTMKNQQSTIKGTIRTAKATEKIAEMKDTGSGYAASFNSYAQKAQRMLDEANAKIKMNEEPKDELSDLREKYKTGSAHAGMTDSLAALRAECGMTEGDN